MKESNLKKIRKSKKLTQKELAELSDTNIRMIQYYEQLTKDINRAEALTIYKIAKALSCNMEDLLNLK